MDRIAIHTITLNETAETLSPASSTHSTLASTQSTPEAVKVLFQDETANQNEPIKRQNVSLRRKRPVFAVFFAVSLCLLRTLIMDLPLFALFGLYVSTHLVERFVEEYIYPQQDLQDLTSQERRDTELTYYHRTCDERDITATDTTDLLIDYTTMTTEDAVQQQLKHGAAVYPNLLSQETADEVRNWILEQNEKDEDMIPVIANYNRWSFGIKVGQHPNVVKILKEVLSHQYLVEAMEKIMGPNPAVIEFTGITSAYGAAEQHYHADVVPEGNGAKWARNFIPSYSLFIPLQNITAAMGATEICPGSHMCAQGCFDYCPDHGFQISGQNDNWPMGWGALLNQQILHRGAAHDDPHGPPRVLFIITFAPRPRFGPFQVETRSIGQGGSYSLHWTQWGHTLRDFQYPEKYMQQPWCFLRSMGLYKPRGTQWGWDYITQISARISNNDNGVSLHDWVKMMNEDNFKYIPKYLHGTVKMDFTQTSREIWNTFYMETLKNCQNAILDIHLKAILAYVTIIISFSLLLKSRRCAVSLVSGIARLTTMHVLVIFIAWIIHQRILQSTFAKNIRSQRSYRWPALPQRPVPYLYATLPTRHDIMVFQDMQSEYLASYSQILDTVHPGNVVWSELLSKYSFGYNNLPLSMQIQLCTSLLQWTHQQGRRILVKNSFNSWAETDDANKLRFCHKELTKRSNAYKSHIIRQIDFLLMECKFGYWRDTKMHQIWIADRLVALQNKVMSFDALSTKSLLITKSDEERNKAQEISPFSVQPSILTYFSSQRGPAISKVLVRPTVVSQETKVQQDSLWINEGDQVDGAYDASMIEWYRGEIYFANSNRYTWDVVYDDGEMGTDLCYNCVKHFEPYEINEAIELIDDNGFWPALIVGVNDDDTYDVQIEDDVITNVLSYQIKRLPRDEGISLGTRIISRHPEGQMWYPGIVSDVNDDGTYAVQFDDGDFLQNVGVTNIRQLPV